MLYITDYADKCRSHLSNGSLYTIKLKQGYSFFGKPVPEKTIHGLYIQQILQCGSYFLEIKTKDGFSRMIPKELIDSMEKI